VTERKKHLLRAIIDRYIDTAEPVGSKSLADEFGLSSATIRAEMAELESKELLTSPHTSAGRAPTVKAYRFYVDELMRRHMLTIRETQELNRALQIRINELDAILSAAGTVISDITNLPAYTAIQTTANVKAARFDFIAVDDRSFIAVIMADNNEVSSRLIRMINPLKEGMLIRAAAVFNSSFANIGADAITEPLLRSAERGIGDNTGLVAAIAQFLCEILSESKRNYQLTGSAKIFDQPEFRNLEKARRLIEYLSEEKNPPGLPSPDSGSETTVTIGAENVAKELADSSVVVTRSSLGDGTDLLIGVVGPTRMNYAAVMSRLQYLADGYASKARDDGG